MSSRPGRSPRCREHLAGPRVDREDDRHLVGDLGKPLDRLAEQRPVDEGRPVQGDEQVVAGLEPEPLRGSGGAEAVLERDQRVDHRVADEVHALVGDALGAQVLDRLVASAGRGSSEKLSATIRLTSSGIVGRSCAGRTRRGRPGSPASTAVSAAARVELTSPGTITRSGRSATQHRLEALHHPRGLLAWVPEPTSSM